MGGAIGATPAFALTGGDWLLAGAEGESGWLAVRSARAGVAAWASEADTYLMPWRVPVHPTISKSTQSPVLLSL